VVHEMASAFVRAFYRPSRLSVLFQKIIHNTRLDALLDSRVHFPLH